MVIKFTVVGKPQPAGSKRAFVNPKTGRAIVTDDNKRSKPWQAEVRVAAAEVMPGELLTGPLKVRMIFYRSRPKAHYGTGRNELRVKDSAPQHPVTKPDVLKLARGVEDALTGVIWRDDAQIVDEVISKRFGEPERCEVEVTDA